MLNLSIISSGFYTCLCRALASPEFLSKSFRLKIFAPEINDSVSNLSSVAGSSHFRIPVKPSIEDYRTIFNAATDFSEFILVYSKNLIPSLIHNNFLCVNFHPSVLPRFPGLDGFEQAYAAGHLGFTAHFIDESIDLGPKIVSLKVAKPGSLSLCSATEISSQMCTLATEYVLRLALGDSLKQSTYMHYEADSLTHLKSDLLV